MIRRVSPAEAHALVAEGGFVYVDVRSVPEFEAGHPQGAFNLPWATDRGLAPNGLAQSEAFVQIAKLRFGVEAKLVLGCEAGSRSLRAAEALVAAGFSNVVDQRAGWGGIKDPFGRVREAGWRAAGLPTATTAAPDRTYAALREGIS